MFDFLKTNKKYNYMLETEYKDRNPIVKYDIQCDKGWIPLLVSLFNIIYILDEDKDIRINQIKEKFGSIRIYYSGLCSIKHKKIIEVIDAFSCIINNTCEICGNHGKLRQSPDICIKTLCNDCAKDYYNE